MSTPLTDSSFDKIRDYILGRSSTLPDHLEQTKLRWNAAFTLMSDTGLKTDRQVAKVLVSLFDISERTAYNDIAASRRLYGDARRVAKDCERYLASENAKELFGKSWDMFLATKKYEWFQAAVAQQKLHMKINCLDKDDPDLPDPSKINPPTQVLQIDIGFIKSQFAQHIDPKAKARINAVLKQIEDLVESSRIEDYLNTTIDIPYINN